MSASTHIVSNKTQTDSIKNNRVKKGISISRNCHYTAVMKKDERLAGHNSTIGDNPTGQSCLLVPPVLFPLIGKGVKCDYI
jgi:hypothetical protein